MRFDRLILIHLLWLLPVAFWPGSNSYDSLKFTVLAVAIALWLGHAAWRGMRGNLTLNFSTRSLLFIGTFIIVLGGGMFTAANQSLVLRTGLLVFLFLFVGVKTMRQRGGLQGQNALLAAVTAGASAVALYGIIQIAGLLPGAPASSGYPAGISTLGNQNYLAGFMAISIWPALILWRQTSGHRKRIISTAALIIIFFALSLAGATGPLVALPTAMILIIPCIVLVRRGYDKVVPPLLGVLVFLAWVTGTALMWDATFSQTEINHSPKPHQALFAANHGNTRMADWLAALDMMEKGSVIGGVGAGNYLVQWPNSRANLDRTNYVSSLPWGAPVSTKAHNDLLQWVAETGLIGLVWLGFG